MNTVKVDFSGLKTLARQLGELEAGKAQVGLFPETSGRSALKGRVQDNPNLGFLHEFGSVKTNLPERSWLRMPLTLHLGPVILAKGTSWLWMLRNRGAKRVLAFLAVMAEEVIQEGFATRGFGGWQKLRPATIRRKGSSAILIETAQMRKAISYRVI